MILRTASLNSASTSTTTIASTTIASTMAFLLLATITLPTTLAQESTSKNIAIDPATSPRPAVQQEPESVVGKEREDYYKLLMIFADTIDQIDRNYVEKVSRRELMEAAIEGALKKLDPYSDYIAPQELDEFKVGVENEFAGVGIQISSQDDQLKIISPLVGSPAHRAGIMAGDLILMIDGNPTKDLSVSDATKAVKGPKGSKVSLTVFHPLTNRTQEVSLTREIIKVATVLGDRRKSDGSWKYMYDDYNKIGYIRVTTFGRETAQDLRNAMQTLTEDGVQSLILDLRFNPGGLLRSAIEVGDMFLHDGTIVSTEGRNIRPKTWSAIERGTYKDFPMVVLVNQFSASASEIVAAALQDHQRAVVIGHQTYGKASVQNVVELEGGKSALKITTGSYQRPSGKPIHHFPGAEEWGVRPNEEFAVPLTDYELQRLINHRYEADIVTDRRSTEATSNFDPQLRRALTHLRKVSNSATKQVTKPGPVPVSVP